MHLFAKALFLIPLFPAVMADWFIKDVYCQDNDCPARLNKNKFSFHYDNGRGILTNCHINAVSPFAIPDGWVNCDNPVVKVRFQDGKKWGGCAGFSFWVALQDGHVNQGKQIHISESGNRGYNCRVSRAPCPPGGGACFNCGGNTCRVDRNFQIQTVPDENPPYNPH